MGDEPLGLLQFRMLGPLEAWRGNTPLRLGGERQRALLALLLVHANQLVRTEELVDRLLGEELSDSALNTARVAVSRLRRLLENGDPGGVLQTRAGGYVLEAGPEQLDAALFERLLGEGRRLLAAGDTAPAAACLREGLALWRGPPLADLAGLEFVQPEIRRLAELRLLAVMERVDADVMLGAGAELVGELEALVASNPMQERLRAQLMLALYRAGRQADALAVYRETSELLRDQLGLEPGRGLQELERQVLRHDPRLEPPSDLAGTVPGRPAVCPFKGLASFDRSDSEYFGGRERAVSELITRVAESTLVGIVGPSGIGKSSLLRAGVLPALSAGVLPGSADWRQALVRPGEHPCAELERALGGEELETAVARLGLGERIVIAVDQLEELFTACQDDGERRAFLEQLAAAARDGARRAVVLASLRADFYGRLASHGRFAESFSRGHVLVGPMTRGELRRAIEVPADRAGLEVEPQLVDALVADVAGEPGGLPLLSTALLELWRGRDGRVLRLHSYLSSGGVNGAVARLAEAAYARLSESEQRIARGVLLRLAGGEDESLVRRRVPIAELGQAGGVEPVVAQLTDARLLTVSDGEVEVSHESLLREWPRYRAWLEEDRVGRRWHTHLMASAREWDSRARDPGELYRGARLAGALDWAAEHGDELSARERGFLDASRRRGEREARRLRGVLAGVALLLVVSLIAGVVALTQKEHAAREARVALARQLGAEAVSEPRIDLAVLLAREALNLDPDQQTEGTLLATLLRSPVAIGTFTAPIDSRPQAVAASPDGRTLAVPDNNGRLFFYDPRTHLQSRPPLTGYGGEAPAYSQDGSLLVHNADGGKGPPFIAVRDARTLSLVAKLRFDRNWLAQPSADNVYAPFLVSPDDHTVYYGWWVVDSAGRPGAAYLDRWSLPSGRRLPAIRIGRGPLAMRLINGGRRLAVLAAGGETVFDSRTLRTLRAVAIPTLSQPGTSAISPDGRTAAIALVTGGVYFADLVTGRLRQGTGGSGQFANVVYSPDGRAVVTTGNDNLVKVWNPSTGTTVQTLAGHAGPVHGAAFSADGRTLYTASLDGVLFEWDLGGGRGFGRPFGVGAPMPCCVPGIPGTPPLAVAPGDARFAARVGPSTIGLFSASTLRQQERFSVAPSAGTVTSLAWSPAGGELAVAGRSGAVQLWNVDGAPRLLRSLAGLAAGRSSAGVVQALAFSPNGALVAASDNSNPTGSGPPDGHLAVWRVSSGALLTAPRHLGQPGDSLAFSPDGRELAVGLDGGSVSILNAATEKSHRSLDPLGSADREPIIALAFAPNGTLATGSFAGIVQLWDPGTGRHVGHPVLVAAGPAASVAFDRGGDRFVTTGGSDGTTKLWFTSTLQEEGTSLGTDPGTWSAAAFDAGGLIVTHDDGTGSAWAATPSAWEQHACAVAGRNLTREEWARFVTGYSYAPVCP